MAIRILDIGQCGFDGPRMASLWQRSLGATVDPSANGDDALRRLEAMLVVADKTSMFLLSGTGDLIEPDEGVIGIGSGGPYALAAAKALIRHTDLSAREIAEHAMNVAASICIYTNSILAIEEL